MVHDYISTLVFTQFSIKPFFTYLYVFILFSVGRLYAQSTDTLQREFTVDLEVRPRLEYRNHFTWMATDKNLSQLYLTQRNRLSLTYRTPHLRLHASPQEIHVWGQNEHFSRIGSVNFFELYAEPSLGKHFLVRIGRQALSLDNGRLFSAAPWGQQSRAHEGIRLFYKKKVETDIMVAITRPYSRRFDPAYSPVASHLYRFLGVHHLKHTFRNQLTLTTINAVDAFESAQRSHFRVTNGGRIEYSKKGFYATVNAYYQQGKNISSKRIQAYYIQPEVSLNSPKTLVRLGAELLSGTKASFPAEEFNSFVPLYGVAWKFMGNMNLFTRFPADVQEKGLVNPYLFVIHRLTKQLSLRADAHLFYSQYPLVREGDPIEGTFLGFESDASVNYKPLKNLEVNYGFSFTRATKRMELLGKVPDSQRIPIWSYLMISFSPRLLTCTRFKVRKKSN